jgi:hypothetical protein
MQRRQLAAAAAVLTIVLWVGTASAQAKADSFYPTNDQYWTGWLDWNGGSPIKNDDTVMWADSPQKRGWYYWNVGSRHTPVDSVAMYYYEFHSYGDYVVRLEWIRGVDPTMRSAGDLWNDLVSGYELGTEEMWVGWHRFSFPPKEEWPEGQMTNRILVGCWADDASPSGVLGKAYGHTGYAGNYRPLLCIYYH